MFADYHVHTRFSDDSVYPMEQVIKRRHSHADERNLFYGSCGLWNKRRLGLFPSNKIPGKRPLANVDYPAYVSKIRELQSAYNTQINIKMAFIHLKKTQSIISEILKIVISSGKCLELNTSCHRYGLSDTTPSVDILKLYRDLGGTIITLRKRFAIFLMVFMLIPALFKHTVIIDVNALFSLPQSFIRNDFFSIKSRCTHDRIKTSLNKGCSKIHQSLYFSGNLAQFQPPASLHLLMV